MADFVEPVSPIPTHEDLQVLKNEIDTLHSRMNELTTQLALVSPMKSPAMQDEPSVVTVMGCTMLDGCNCAHHRVFTNLDSPPTTRGPSPPSSPPTKAATHLLSKETPPANHFSGLLAEASSNPPLTPDDSRILELEAKVEGDANAMIAVQGRIAQMQEKAFSLLTQSQSARKVAEDEVARLREELALKDKKLQAQTKKLSEKKPGISSPVKAAPRTASQMEEINKVKHKFEEDISKLYAKNALLEHSIQSKDKALQATGQELEELRSTSDGRAWALERELERERQGRIELQAELDRIRADSGDSGVK